MRRLSATRSNLCRKCVQIPSSSATSTSLPSYQPCCSRGCSPFLTPCASNQSCEIIYCSKQEPKCKQNVAINTCVPSFEADTFSSIMKKAQRISCNNQDCPAFPVCPHAIGCSSCRPIKKKDNYYPPCLPEPSLMPGLRFPCDRPQPCYVPRKVPCKPPSVFVKCPPCGRSPYINYCVYPTPCRYTPPCRRSPCRYTPPCRRSPCRYTPPCRRSPCRYIPPCRRSPCQFRSSCRVTPPCSALCDGSCQTPPCKRYTCRHGYPYSATISPCASWLNCTKTCSDLSFPPPCRPIYCTSTKSNTSVDKNRKTRKKYICQENCCKSKKSQPCIVKKIYKSKLPSADIMNYQRINIKINSPPPPPPPNQVHQKTNSTPPPPPPKELKICNRKTCDALPKCTKCGKSKLHEEDNILPIIIGANKLIPTGKEERDTNNKGNIRPDDQKNENVKSKDLVPPPPSSPIQTCYQVENPFVVDIKGSHCCEKKKNANSCPDILKPCTHWKVPKIKVHSNPGQVQVLQKRRCKRTIVKK